MDVAVPGKLKIKKGKGTSGGIGKTKKLSTKKLNSAAAATCTNHGEKSDNKVGESPNPMAAPRRTKAEMAFMKRYQKTVDKRIAEKAQLSHREKVEAFNEKMGAMSEFNDIPKVSWTK